MERSSLSLLAFVVNVVVLMVSAENTVIELRAPVVPEAAGKESYMCMTTNLPDKPQRLIGVRPLAKKEIVHHMLLFGCSKPVKPPRGNETTAWECLGHATCEGGMEEIVFGWAKDAPAMVYPDDVGLAVGPGSKIKYIVVQVHYLQGQPANDDSGVRLVLSDEPRPMGAGLLTFAEYFTIPARTPVYHVNNTCCYRGVEPLNTFAMRVHTHDLGRAVWMERNVSSPLVNGGQQLEMVAGKDPQLPQAFYPVSKHAFWPGQNLKAICQFNSSLVDHPVTTGSTHEFEMCNLYMMVFSRLPFLAMCTRGELGGGIGSPGALSAEFTLVPDSSGFTPPDPKSSGLWGAVAGDITSAASAADGTLWVLYRGQHHWAGDTFNGEHVATNKSLIAERVVMKLNADTGETLEAWGHDKFHMPHMITVDKDDNVWIADVGLHQVFKMSPAGKVLLEVGETFQPGNDEDHFCKPTQVAPLLDGSFIVADGYCNNRVVKFAADGKYMAALELPMDDGMQPVVHSVMVDECRGVALVVMREAGLVHMVDLDPLKLVGTYDLRKYGRLWSVKMGPYGSPIVLAWQEGQPIKLLQLGKDDTAPLPRGPTQPELELELPNGPGQLPNDFAIGAASLNLTGAGDRLLAFYIAKTCPDCGPVSKWVALPRGFQLPPKAVADSTRQPQLAAENTTNQAGDQAADTTSTSTGTTTSTTAPPAGDSESQMVEDLTRFAGGVFNRKNRKNRRSAPQAKLNTSTIAPTPSAGGQEVTLQPLAAEQPHPQQQAVSDILQQLQAGSSQGAMPLPQNGSGSLNQGPVARPSVPAGETGWGSGVSGSASAMQNVAGQKAVEYGEGAMGVVAGKPGNGTTAGKAAGAAQGSADADEESLVEESGDGVLATAENTNNGGEQDEEAAAGLIAGQKSHQDADPGELPTQSATGTASDPAGGPAAETIDAKTTGGGSKQVGAANPAVADSLPAGGNATAVGNTPTIPGSTMVSGSTAMPGSAAAVAGSATVPSRTTTIPGRAAVPGATTLPESTATVPGATTVSESTTTVPGATTVTATVPGSATGAAGGAPAATPPGGVPATPPTLPEDPALRIAQDWDAQTDEEDYTEADYADKLAKLERKAQAPQAVLKVSVQPVNQTLGPLETDLTVVGRRYTTRSGNAVQVVLVACIIAVFLAVFAINTLGSMRARVYHPLPTRDIGLPVANSHAASSSLHTNNSPFIVEGVGKYTHRRRG